MHTFFQSLLSFKAIKLSPNPAKGIYILALLATIYYACFGGVFAVTGEMSRWGGALISLFGFDINSLEYYRKIHASSPLLERTDGVMLLSLVLSCWLAAALSARAKWRGVASPLRATMALIGGFLAGFGARLAGGCNLANFFTGIPYFSLHPWVFAVFMLLGIIAALRFLPSSAALAQRTCWQDKQQSTHKINKIAIIPALCLIVLFIYLGLGKNSALAAALLFGAAFGAVIFSQQICFTSLFRDLILFSRGKTAIACFAAMAISAVAVWVLQQHGFGAKALALSPALMIGGFIFGFGIILAGGCECGFIFRAASGQVHFILVGVGNVLGTIALAFFNEQIKGGFMYSGTAIKLSGFGGLMILLALCALSCLLIYLASLRKVNIKPMNMPSGNGSVIRVYALGEPCPYPALIYHSYKHLLNHSEISTLEIICDCEQSLAHVPPSAQTDGLNCQVHQAGAQIVFEISK